jgi:hypothetical protein
MILFKVLIELADMLHGYGMSMPKEVHFQWDNCGENKNKYVFMYSALLVELDFIFDFVLSETLLSKENK